MTDKEILSELKKSYEYLYDILENGNAEHCNGQLNKILTNNLEIAKQKIINTYTSFYRTLNREKLKVKTINGDSYYISSDISIDYDIYDNNNKLVEDVFSTCEDLNYCWFNDEEFLLK